MKICDNCGHPNFTVNVVKKKPVCSECKNIMSDSWQCSPTRKTNPIGQPKNGETNKLCSEYEVDRNDYEW